MRKVGRIVCLGASGALALMGCLEVDSLESDTMDNTVAAELSEAPSGTQPFINRPENAELLGLRSLDDVHVPLPEGLGDFVKDKDELLVLGKALFWDMQVGSDGVQSCASCHFHAGVDNRTKNQLHPDLIRVANQREGDVEGFFNAPLRPDEAFQLGGPNYTLVRNSFPFIRDIGDGDENGANVVPQGDTIAPAPGNTNDVASSQGVFLTEFEKVRAREAVDRGEALEDPVFNVDGCTVRRVEPRHTPSVINAVLNFANFWDGRANPYFNGVNPFGKQDLDARIFVKRDGEIHTKEIALLNASLASQAVGPPLSAFEMSFDGRTWPEIGRKMVWMKPLRMQKVHADDSVLADYRDDDGRGLHGTYAGLIKQAFKSKYWDSDKFIVLSEDGKDFEVVPWSDRRPERAFTLMEMNFSLFFGLALNFYQATLVSDKTPFDKWMEKGRFSSGFGEKELHGLNLFVGKGRCVNCHGGAEFTNASVSNAQKGRNVIEPMIMGDGDAAFYDNGFYNISTTPTPEDLGRGGADPFGRPLAFSRQFAFEALDIDNMPFPILGNPVRDVVCDPDDTMDNGNCDKDILGFINPDNGEFIPVCVDKDDNEKCDDEDELLLRRVAVDGAFKTPSLRNIELTGPYFHNGSVATLLEVVEFYDRGGNFCRFNFPDLDPDIQPIGFQPDEEEALVAFLISLTDPRVQKKRAPFDHPQLFIPNGHPGDANTLTEYNEVDGICQAKDDLIEIKEVGKQGVPRGEELRPFLEVDHMTSNPVAGGNCSPNSMSQPVAMGP